MGRGKDFSTTSYDLCLGKCNYTKKILQFQQNQVEAEDLLSNMYRLPTMLTTLLMEEREWRMVESGDLAIERDLNCGMATII